MSMNHVNLLLADCLWDLLYFCTNSDGTYFVSIKLVLPRSLKNMVASSAARGVGPIHFIFIFLKFCFPGSIDEVVVAVTCCNNVSLASPYLEDVRSSTGEGHVRVCVARYVDYLRILIVGVSIKVRNGSLVLLVRQFRHLLSCCSATWSGFFSSLNW